MGERFLVVAVVVAATGCGTSERSSTLDSAAAGSSGASSAGAGAGAVGTGGSAGSGNVNGGSGGIGGAGAAGAAGSSSGAGGLAPEDSRSFAWESCGTVPSTEVPPDTMYELGPIQGGHPRVTGDPLWSITGLAMSADGLTLVSMGRVTLVWDVASDFSASHAVVVDGAVPEWPKVDVSPDGRWIAISGDGRKVVSRSGTVGVDLASPIDLVEPCFPIELRFSPDGEWLVGAGWTGELDLFRIADLEAAASGNGFLEPSLSIPSSCAPAGPPLVTGSGPPARSTFTPDGQNLVVETGARYATDDWRELASPVAVPAPHGLRGGFEVSALGATLVSDCTNDRQTGDKVCLPHGAPFPKFSPEGHWIVAGGRLMHTSGETRVLDATALVGTFAPNGDVIAAGADNSLTRYCRAK